MELKTLNRIFLIGFMGSGKSSIGKKLAKLLQYDFIDTDKHIELSAGKSITNIFSQEGELFFREQERELLRKLNEQENIVVSTGGGMPCYKDNVVIMNKMGVTIYLKSTPKLLANRLIKRQNERPILRSVSQKDLDKFIATLLPEREKYYEQADFVLSVYNLTASDILLAINSENKLAE
ncbi:MAG: shikimate kinase [Bacteroidales bacterium]|nr:shikimate kinase [Bacteroidales bacterium]